MPECNKDRDNVPIDPSQQRLAKRVEDRWRPGIITTILVPLEACKKCDPPCVAFIMGDKWIWHGMGEKTLKEQYGIKIENSKIKITEDELNADWLTNAQY